LAGEDGKQKREHYRIEYPVAERPLFLFKNLKLRAIDVSEKGAQVEFEKEKLPRIGETIRVSIIFCSGDRAEVEGQVMRISESRVIFALTKGVKLSHIMAEQRYLIKKFGDLSNK